MKVITVINQKGGVGKSTTALALGHGLMSKGHHVLFIDLDPQGNMSYTLKADTGGYNSLGALQHPETALDEIQVSSLGFVIPSTPQLVNADNILTQVGKEYKLKESIDLIENNRDFDYIIIDTPPALGILTVNALTASDFAIIPAQADIYSLQGVYQLSETIQVIQKYTNPQLKVLGILLTRYNGRTSLSKELTNILEETAKQLGTKLFDTRIRENIAVKEAQAVKQNLFKYAPRSNASNDYLSLLDELKEEL